MKDFRGWHVVAIVLILCVTVLMALGYNSILHWALLSIVGSVFGIDIVRHVTGGSGDVK